MVISVDGITESQMRALCEEHWDTTSYKKYDPMDIVEATVAGVKDYDLYLEHEKRDCRYPTTYIKRRRFTIPIADLSNKGIDVGRLMDRHDLYDPQPEFDRLEIFDRLNSKYVEATDGLNLIQPLADNELKLP